MSAFECGCVVGIGYFNLSDSNRSGSVGGAKGFRRLIDGEVPRGDKMLYSGNDPESYITEYTLVYEDE